MLNPERVPYLTAEERAQVDELLARLEMECEADVSRVILYGSKARGDAVQWSDVDLLVATTNGAERVEKFAVSLSMMIPLWQRKFFRARVGKIFSD